MNAPALAAYLALALQTSAAAASDGTFGATRLDSVAIWHRAGNAAGVDRALGPAIAAARGRQDERALRELLLARGRSRAAFGLASQAEPDLREALALARSACDTASQLAGLRWLGVCTTQLGRVAEGTRAYRELAKLAKAVADSQHLGWAWLGLAFDHYQAGHSGSAAALYQRAAQVLARRGESKGATYAFSGYGLALRQQGDYAGAAAAFGRALAGARATGDVFNEAAALNYLGRLELQVGDPGRAATMLEAALAIHRRHGHHREGALAAIDVATACALQGRLERAAAQLDAARTNCETAGLLDLELLATDELAHVRLAQGRPNAAASGCRQALAHRELPSTMLGVELRLSLAQALVAKDSLAAALAVLDDARRLGPGATSLALRLAADRGLLLTRLGRAAEARQVLRVAIDAARAAGTHELQVSLLTAAARAELAAGAPESAIPLFLQAADAWEASRALPVDPEWRELRGAAAADLFSPGCATLRAHPAALDPGQRTLAAFAFAQRYKARTLQERLRGPGQHLNVVATPSDTVRRCGALLRAGDVLLDFVQGDELAVVFCVTPETTLAGVLPGARATAPQLQRVEDLLDGNMPDTARLLAQAAARIADQWPVAVRERLGQGRRVYFSPDGTLHRLPLALLCGPRPTALLSEHCELVRLPAIALLRAPARRAREAQDAARVLMIAGRDSLRDAPLPGAAAETRWLAARLEHVDDIAGSEWSWGDSAAWRRADVLHLASHVRIDPQQPWNTAIVWGRGEDGELRARDAARLRLRAKLAVLSGCRTVGARTVPGEGLVGLSAGFLVAGTSSVIATLWPIDDLAAARFTMQLYAALADGQSVGSALARTREALRSHSETSSPRHWAGFVLVGDPDLQVPLRMRRRAWPLAVGLAALAAVFAAGAAVRSPRRRTSIP